MRSAIVLCLLLCTFRSSGRSDTTHLFVPSHTKSLNVLTGVHWQNNTDSLKRYPNRLYFELGLHLSLLNDAAMTEPPTIFTHGISLEFSPGKTSIYGFKYGAWLSVNAISLGLSTVYYTNFDKGNFRIRPEFGFGVAACRLVMGINIPTIGNADYPELQQSWVQFSLNVLLKAKTIKQTTYAPVPDYRHRTRLD